MAERRVPRGTRDPIVVALSLALREVAERRAEDQARRRATMRVIEGAKRDGGQAA
jgi:hypothetical protein